MNRITCPKTYVIQRFHCRCFYIKMVTSVYILHVHVFLLSVQVLFNLANQYHANKSYAKAINTYLLIVKNKLFSSGGK